MPSNFLSKQRLRATIVTGVTLQRLALCCLLVGLYSSVAFAQKIKVLEPEIPSGAVFLAPGVVDLKFEVSQDIKLVRVVVTTKNDADKSTITIVPDKSRYPHTVKLLKGTNKIDLFAFREGEDEAAGTASLTVTCSGEKCGQTGSSAGGGIGDPGPKPPKPPGNITFVYPKKDGKVPGFFKSAIVVEPASNIKRMLLLVTNNGELIEQPRRELTIDPSQGPVVSPDVRVKTGDNIITVLNLDNPLDEKSQASVTVKCEKDCDASPSEALRINIPEEGQKLNDASVNSQITIKKSSNISKVFVRVLNNGQPLDDPLEASVSTDRDTLDVQYEEGKTERVLTPKIRLGKGSNIITVFDATKDISVSPQHTVLVTCTGEKCGTESAITVREPVSPFNTDSSFLDSYVKVDAESRIKAIRYDVTNEDKNVFISDKFLVKEKDGKPEPLRIRLRYLRGKNIIRFFNADDQTNTNHQAFLNVECTGDNCLSDFDIAKYPSNSENARVAVGLEQAGASSADSETKPFVDFTFSTPFFFGRCSRPREPETSAAPTPEERLKMAEYLAKLEDYKTCVSLRRPRLAAWGQLRLTATPDQIAAVGVLPSNFVNQQGTRNSTVDLVQSFDFILGLEGRLFSANGSFLSLIPGIRQRTDFYLAGGGGAINPLTARRELAEIYNIPVVGSPQRDDFIDRYGTPPAGKDFVGLLPLDRDRFLRQWYAGLRLKTRYCDNEDCTLFKNRFPAIFDFMVGQNEAVTGGSLYFLTEDPNDPTRTIKKRSYVLRFDAFYPFPLREANFLYFYGMAMMKIGAGGVRIQNPLFLDRSDGGIQITDTRVYIPPPDFQRRFQPSRDYYKFGVGINLTELFNRNKNPQ